VLPPYTTTDELARVLEMRSPSAAQVADMQRMIDAAGLEIVSECGTAYGTAAPAGTLALLAEVNLERAVEHWQQSKAPFGVVGFGDSIPVMVARDTWDRHAHKLAPLKTSWGLA
jgi:hypothetical protein